MKKLAVIALLFLVAFSLNAQSDINSTNDFTGIWAMGIFNEKIYFKIKKNNTVVRYEEGVRDKGSIHFNQGDSLQLRFKKDTIVFRWFNETLHYYWRIKTKFDYLLILRKSTKRTLFGAKKQSKRDILNYRKDFEILINESSMMNDNNYKITQDSIIIDKRTNFINSQTGSYSPRLYSRNLSKVEKNQLVDRIMLLQPNKLKSNYVDHSASDCDLEYDWTITLNNKTNKIRVYKTKIESLLELSYMINEFLPTKYQISYNEMYLKR